MSLRERILAWAEFRSKSIAVMMLDRQTHVGLVECHNPALVVRIVELKFPDRDRNH